MRIGGYVVRLGPALLVGGVLALWGAGCGADLGPVTEGGGGGGGGRICYQDSDCVPDGCCGRATDAIHVDDAPDCSQVACDGQCPVNQINCGCGIPVCSNSHCAVAVTTGPGCPTLRGNPPSLNGFGPEP